MTLSSDTYRLETDKDRLIPGLLHICDLPVDVFPSGGGFIGVSGKPAADSLFQFVFPTVMVNCRPTYSPDTKQRAATVFLDDGGRAIQGGNMNYRLDGYSDIDFDLHDVDDDMNGYLSVYSARIRLNIRKGRSIETMARIETYLLDNVIKLELEKRGYSLQSARYALPAFPGLQR